MLCNLQIISGCVCHLEQLHAQSPFLFPIVFSINLIPFFDICSVLAKLLYFHPGCSGLCSFTWAAARSQLLLFVVWQVVWCFTAGCHVKSPLFPGSPLSNRRVLQHTRPSTFHNPMLSANKHAVPRSRLPCRLFRLSVEPRLSTALKDRSVVPWS